MLPRHNKDWKSLTRYVSGESDGRERNRIEARISVDEELGKLADEVQHVWALTDLPEGPSDIGASWSRLDEKVRRMERQPGPVLVHPSVLRRNVARSAPARRDRMYTLRLAAVLALAALTTVLVVRFVGTKPEGAPVAQAKTFRTEKGRRAEIRLTDGTRVLLNVDSKLTLPAAFAAGPRDVLLEGEALFEVAPDTARPFVVHTREASVRVMGTVFGVRAYTEEPLRIAVREGHVRLQATDAARRDTVHLWKNHVARLTPRGIRVETIPDVEPYLDWTRGRLVFRAASFDRVADELERFYDLDIDVTVPSGRIGKLTASFGDEPLSEILNAVAGALGLDYERERRRITFFPASETVEASREP